MSMAGVIRRLGAISHEFMFATGVEISYPTIEADGKTIRRDGMELSGHYQRWKEDFKLVKELGLHFLRYGPPLYKTHVGPGRYHWDFADETFNALREMGIHPIADLCHFGLADWQGGFENPEWPAHFANYAHAFARRFPWVRLYTPVNEVFTCALFSGLRGWWNERRQNDRGFVTAVKHMCQATLLAEQQILKVQPEAIFIQSESSSYYHRETPSASERAYFENQRRFLALDLCYGNDVSGVMRKYISHNGISEEEYDWFLKQGKALVPHCIMGNDYYADNEFLVTADGDDTIHTGEIFGYYVITHQYFARYRRPVMHTETNRRDNADKAAHWLKKQWMNLLKLKEDGVPILGFTWYSLIDQTDWDSGLRELNYRTDPCGLFDKDRHPHPVAGEYAKIVREWSGYLPA